MKLYASRRGVVRARGRYGPALALGLLLSALSLSQVRAQSVPTAPGTVITNTAVASFDRAPGLTDTRQSNAVATTVLPARTKAQVQLLRVATAPAAGGTATSIAPTACRTAAGTLTTLPAPVLISGTTLDLTQPVAVVSEHVFHGGEPIFVRVADADQNLDPAQRDTLEVRLVAAVTQDTETLVLYETGPNTGVFAGYVPTRVGAAASGDCTLEVARASTLESHYTDAADPTDVASATASVDPQGTVFDSRTGQPVSGARIRLVDAATGAPASVFGDDGRSSYPADVTSGATVTDSGGTLYQFPPGTFRFPVVPTAGSYKLVIEPPGGYLYPSAVDPGTLAALPGGPFTLSDGSFGRAYAVTSPVAVTIDVPLDAVGGPLVVTKVASQASVAEGDAVEYTVTVRNAGVVPARDAHVTDQLPVGFRYAAGSAHTGDAPARVKLADPAIDASGRGLDFRIGDVAAGGAVTLRYVTRIGAGARPGPATNRARAMVAGLESNTAEASVLVTSDLIRDRGFIVGQVTDGDCSAHEAGVGGVRVYLEDGRMAVTDAEGRYHFEDLKPGTHVLALDRTTLPAGATPVGCAERASERDGRTRMIDLRAGALARADFVVKVPAASSLLGAARAAAPPTPAPGAADLEVLERVPRLESLVPGRELLLPSAGFHPAIPAVHVAVKHAPTEVVAVTVNGVPVAEVTRDHTLFDAGHTLAVSRWRGVALEEGDNRIVAVVRDAAGTEVARLERSVHYGGTAVRAELDAEHSVLIADGRTRPVLALRLYDRYGQAARPGTQGAYRVEAPYRSYAEVEALKDNPLIAVAPREPVYLVGSDGLVRVELAPTSDAGTAVVRLRLGERREQEIRAWLQPAAREFILVGLAEGTAAYRTVTEHSAALPPDAPPEGYEGDGRVAFFAKGQVLGSYLLTLAYDSDRDRQPIDPRIQGVVDPHKYYTLYGDASEMRDDAPSQRKVFIKLERREFVALFGDFDTGFTVTELARYSRRLNGVRVEGGTGAVRGIAFAARTADLAGRDVIVGDGTSGPYKLSSGGLVAGGDSVRIEVRDRFRSEVIVSTTPLTRYLDYDIDYLAGTLFFRRPVPSRDEALNPVYIVAEYEVAGNGAEHTTAGARATVKALGDRVEAGATLLREGASAGDRRLGGLDVRAQLGGTTLLKAEVARTETTDPALAARGNAYLAEITTAERTLDGRAYFREQGEGFGMGQQALTETATRKYGAEGRWRVTDAWSVRSQAYDQRALDRDAERRLAEAELHYEQGPRTAGVGLRTASDHTDAADTRSNQVYANLARDVLDGRVLLKGTVETALGGRDDSADFPDRVRLGADYRLSPGYTLFTSYERSHGALTAGDLLRLGVKAEPWAGGQLETALNESDGENGTRLYSNLGLTQGWRPTEKVALDAGVERSSTLSGVPARPIVGPLFGTTPATDFTAAFLGGTVRVPGWTWVSRLERRDGETENRSIASLGGYREPRAGQAFSLALRYVDATQLAGRTTTADTRLSWAYRPRGSRLIALDRLDLIYETNLGIESVRIVNNAHLNLVLDPRTQLGLQLGARLGRQTFSGDQYQGYSGLYGVDLRRDLDAAWDVGLQLTLFDTPAAHTREYSAGLDVGRRFGRQLWVSLGWNLAGFSDRDFSRDRYTARGPYLRFRMQVDQDSFRELLDGFKAGTRL